MKETKHIKKKWEEYKEILYKHYKKTNWLDYKENPPKTKEEYYKFFDSDKEGYKKQFLEQIKVLIYGLKKGKVVFIQGSTYNQWSFRVLYKNNLYNFDNWFCKLISSSYQNNKQMFILGGYGYSRTCHLWYDMVYCVGGKANEQYKQNYKEL